MIDHENTSTHFWNNEERYAWQLDDFCAHCINIHDFEKLKNLISSQVIPNPLDRHDFHKAIGAGVDLAIENNNFQALDILATTEKRKHFIGVRLAQYGQKTYEKYVKEFTDEDLEDIFGHQRSFPVIPHIVASQNIKGGRNLEKLLARNSIPWANIACLYKHLELSNDDYLSLASCFTDLFYFNPSKKNLHRGAAAANKILGDVLKKIPEKESVATIAYRGALAAAEYDMSKIFMWCAKKTSLDTYLLAGVFAHNKDWVEKLVRAQTQPTKILTFLIPQCGPELKEKLEDVQKNLIIEEKNRYHKKFNKSIDFAVRNTSQKAKM